MTAFLLALLAACTASSAKTPARIESRSALTPPQLRAVMARSVHDASSLRKGLSAEAAGADQARIVGRSTMPPGRLAVVLRAAAFSEDLSRAIDARSDYTDAELKRVRVETGKNVQALVDRRSAPDEGRLEKRSSGEGAAEVRRRATARDTVEGLRDRALPKKRELAALRRFSTLGAREVRSLLGRSAD